MPTHCRNCLETNCVHYISSALSFLPLVRGWTTIHHRQHPRAPLLPLNHATTCVLDITTQLSSPTPPRANLWNTDLLADPTTRNIWLCSTSNEFRRLAQGLPDNCVDATNTIFFTPITEVPCHKCPTYARFVCSFRPQKPEPYLTCIAIGGNLIDYLGILSMKVADMTMFKILVNSTLSTPSAKWLGLYVKN